MVSSYKHSWIRINNIELKRFVKQIPYRFSIFWVFILKIFFSPCQQFEIVQFRRDNYNRFYFWIKFSRISHFHYQWLLAITVRHFAHAFMRTLETISSWYEEIILGWNKQWTFKTNLIEAILLDTLCTQKYLKSSVEGKKFHIEWFCFFFCYFISVQCNEHFSDIFFEWIYPTVVSRFMIYSTTEMYFAYPFDRAFNFKKTEKNRPVQATIVGSIRKI